MRKMFMSAVLASVMMLSPGFTPQAQASYSWLSIGTVFRIGAAHIAFVLGGPGYGYEPGYYYRYDQPIHYRGHSCSRYCFREAGYYYHHESCPLVAAHFASYRVDPRWAFDRYAPRYSGYDSYDRYDGYYRGGGYGYDRGYRDRYDRYDDRDRYDHRSGYYRDDYRNDSYRGHDRRYDRYDRHDRNDRHDRHDRDHRDHDHGHRHYRGRGY